MFLRTNIAAIAVLWCTINAQNCIRPIDAALHQQQGTPLDHTIRKGSICVHNTTASNIILRLRIGNPAEPIRYFLRPVEKTYAPTFDITISKAALHTHCMYFATPLEIAAFRQTKYGNFVLNQAQALANGYLKNPSANIAFSARGIPCIQTSEKTYVEYAPSGRFRFSQRYGQMLGLQKLLEEPGVTTSWQGMNPEVFILPPQHYIVLPPKLLEQSIEVLCWLVPPSPDVTTDGQAVDLSPWNKGIIVYGCTLDAPQPYHIGTLALQHSDMPLIKAFYILFSQIPHVNKDHQVILEQASYL